MNRRHRFLTAVLTLIAILFSQLAVAAYSCPMLTEVAPAVSSGAPCDLSGMDLPNLCESHCKHGSASFESAKNPVSPLLAVDAALRVPALHSLPLRTQPVLASRASVPAPPPPLLRFTVLRI